MSTRLPEKIQKLILAKIVKKNKNIVSTCGKSTIDHLPKTIKKKC